MKRFFLIFIITTFYSCSKESTNLNYNLEDGINSREEFISIITSTNKPESFSEISYSQLKKLGETLEFKNNKLTTGDFSEISNKISKEKFQKFLYTFFNNNVVFNGDFTNARIESPEIAYEGYKWVDAHNCKVNRKYICFK